jgi:hypothetical protein
MPVNAVSPATGVMGARLLEEHPDEASPVEQAHEFSEEFALVPVLTVHPWFALFARAPPADQPAKANIARATALMRTLRLIGIDCLLDLESG